ncbi:hypothetical protein [Xanthomonas arboricola]|uniref:hypothetical protein n=1 Tax=Xanthomonas arboricola TaxID=56448 RepID=UPI0011B0CD3A|nr:hypothetical protein [Xanthomonas arboricola]
MFFSKNLVKIESIKNYINNEKFRDIYKITNICIDLIHNDIARYDNLCKHVPDEMGEIFLSRIKSDIDDKDVALSLFFLTACVREVTLQKPSRLAKEQDVLDFFEEKSDHPSLYWDGFHGYYKDYINTLLPLKLAGNPIEKSQEIKFEISRIKGETEIFRDELGIKIDEWREEIATSSLKAKNEALQELRELSEQIEEHKKQLKNLESEYNFVGLSHAFRKMLISKTAESRRYFYGMIFIGLTALLAPGMAIWLAKIGFFDASLSGNWSALSALKIIGIIGVEMILLYYFRISLKSFLLIKEQHSNLSLRLAICQFIEGYADFSKRSRDNGSDLMKGFENLIFSPLPSNDGSLPATIDGLESIAKIFESLKR